MSFYCDIEPATGLPLYEINVWDILSNKPFSFYAWFKYQNWRLIPLIFNNLNCISPIHTIVNIPALLLKNTLRFLIRAGILTKVWIGDIVYIDLYVFKFTIKNLSYKPASDSLKIRLWIVITLAVFIIVAFCTFC